MWLIACHGDTAMRHPFQGDLNTLDGVAKECLAVTVVYVEAGLSQIWTHFVMRVVETNAIEVS